MKIELIGKSLSKITFIILVIENILRLSSLISSVNGFYSDIFSGPLNGLDGVILYFIPFINMLLLIMYMISTYLLKKPKDLNF
jgi:hypothetical protein